MGYLNPGGGKGVPAPPAPKKQDDSDHGFLGTGIGPSISSVIGDSALGHAWNAATFGLKSLAGLTTGTASFLYHGAAAAGHLGSVGLADLQGKNPAPYWKAAHSDLSAAGQYPVGMVQGTAQGLSNLADIPAIIPGVQGYGQSVNRATGVGLAEIGAAASNKPLSHSQIAHSAQALAPPSFEQASHAEGGYLNPLLNTVGALATIGGGLKMGGDFAAGVDSEAHPGIASAGQKVAEAGQVLQHPLRGTFSGTLGALGQAAKLQRDRSSLNLNPEAQAYYDAYGKDLGMRPPNAVVNDEASNTINTGAPMANEYQTKPTSVSELSPEEQAATAKAYGTAPDAKTGLIPETAAQFEHLTKPVEQGGMGVKVDYVDRADNPYAQADGSTNYDAMRKDIVENKHIYVDKTSPDEANPILTPEQNNQFRAVHDVFGHSVAGNRFDANGEEVAYQHHAQMYSPDAQRALAMETRGQNSELNYSPENLARAAEGESKQFGPQRAGVMSKESSAPGYTHEPTEAELRSPTAAKETARTLKGPAPWAERAVSHLKPQGAANRVLASVESLHQGHALSVIDREQARYTEAQMNIADKKEPFIKAMGRAVEALRKEHPELKPHQASAMLGDELRSRITGATAPDLAKRAKEGGAPAHVVERLQRVGHQKGSMMPREFLTPAVEKSLRDLQDSYAGFQAKVHEGFAASETLADRGLSDMGPKDEQGQPRWTKQQRVLQQRIDKLESIAAKARTAKQEREIRRLTKERDALTTQKGRADEKVAQAQAERERAAEGVEAQRTHVPEPEAKPGKPLTKAVDENGEPRKVFHGTAHEFEKFDMGKKNYPGEGRALYFSGNRDVAATYGGEGSHVREQYLDLQNPAHEQFPRSGISPAEIADLKARGYDGIIMDDPARPGNKEYAVFDESQIHDTPDTLPREQVLPAPKTAKQMVRSTGPAPNEERQAAEAELRTNLAKIAGLPGKGQLRGAKSAEGDRMRVERQQLEQGIAANKDTIKNASKEEAPSSAYSRGVNIAYSARDVVDATNKLYEAQKVSDALQREIDKRTAKIEGTDLTDAEKEAQRADLLRVKTQMRLTKSLEDAPPAQWPREYRPAGVELEKLQEEAKTDPELRQWIEGAEPTFRTMMTRLAAMGIDPQYVRDFTPTQVGRAMADTVKVNPGKILIAGARKGWTGALQRADNGSLDTSLEGFAAAMHEMYREQAQNIGVDYFRRNYAVPIRPGTVVDPKQWVPWDPARSYLQSGREGENLVTAGGTKYVIPKTLDDAFRAAEQDYTTKAGKFLSHFTNPWRTAVITASPGFYVQHVISHAVLASLEGVNLSDWAHAWQEYRARGNGNIYDMLQGHSIAREAGAPATLTPAQGMRERMRTELLAAKADGRGLIGTARAGASGATHGLASTLHNFTNVTDALSRTAVYLHDSNKPGFNDVDALNRAYAGVVDYSDLNNVEQNLVRQVVPFYSFQKQILKIAAKMPVDHPIVAALAAQFYRINQQQQKDAWGQSLTDGYSGVIPIGGGGGLDTRKINPFKDAAGLVTPDGIASSLHPLIGEALRYFLHAPSGGFVQARTVDPYGNEVPQLTTGQITRDLFGGIPGVAEAQAVTGGSARGPLAQTGAFLGANVRTKEDMQKIADKIAGSRAAAAGNKPFASKGSTTYGPPVTKKKGSGYLGG